jgi:AraC-like DNA-binding protein
LGNFAKYYKTTNILQNKDIKEKLTNKRPYLIDYMKKITLSYGANLDWVHSFASKFEGKISGNYIKVSNEIYTGDMYFLDCGEEIVALYTNGIYHTDLQLTHKNKKKDFVCIQYNLSEDEAEISFEDTSNKAGASFFNLMLIDSALEHKYNIKKRSKSFVLQIFIKKEALDSFLLKSNLYNKTIEKKVDPAIYNHIKWFRMSCQSQQLLMDTQKFKIGGIYFDLTLTGTVHILISECLDILSNKKKFISLENELDLPNIIKIQQFLLENIENLYPGNSFLAQKANMSMSKFNSTFKKLTGISANNFFLHHKLNKTKAVLKEKQLSIKEISNNFNFSDNSHFVAKFKEHFGTSPKNFINNL